MRYTYSDRPARDIAVDTLVCFVTHFDKISNKLLKSVDGATGGAVSTLLKSSEFSGKEGESALFYNVDGFQANRVVLLGLGEKKKITPDTYRRVVGTASRMKTVTNVATVAFDFDNLEKAEMFQAAAEGYLLGSFQIVEYKTVDESRKIERPKELTFVVGRKPLLARLQKSVEQGIARAEGQLLARQLTLTPSNKLTPALYADKVAALAREHKVSCRVLDEKAIEREKMGALMAVARGSDEPPRFIVLEYNGGPKGQKPIVLVGKGVTFDSGGISLKPSLNMHEMKQDMAGSAVVASTLMTAARLKLPRNLVGLIPAAENMPSGHATRPGDIITSRKGLTIEDINTDAEGRLLLADALDYADKFKPQAVIDIATLTGASLYILGYSGAPIMGNRKKLMDQIRAASEMTSERVWELPIWDDFREQMKSGIADLVNSGGKPAGTIAAGAFLEYFIGDWPWAHIDIAYVDLEPSGKPYIPKGATGFGVRLLVEVLSNWKKV